VIFGVINMGDPQPETPETVAARIRAALEHLPPERLIPSPDCGMKYIPRATASPSSRHLPRVRRSSAVN
jgi:5-methyltetrahydropteroyltriglutamate--homocysteine methyltransferase